MVRRAATFTVKTGHWQNTSRRKPEQLNINPWIRSVSSWKKVYKKRNFIWGQNAAGRCVSVSDVCGDAARSRSCVIIFSRRPLLWCPPFRDLPHCVRHIPLRLRGGAALNKLKLKGLRPFGLFPCKALQERGSRRPCTKKAQRKALSFNLFAEREGFELNSQQPLHTPN